jgi:hypothetical protein
MKERKSKKPSKTTTFLPLFFDCGNILWAITFLKKIHTGNGSFSAILLHRFQLIFPITSVKLN